MGDRVYEPADAVWDAINDLDLTAVDADTIVGSAEVRLGYRIGGHHRIDLLSLAQGEIDFERGEE